MESKAYSQRRACKLLGIHRATCRYKPILEEANKCITELLLDLADTHKRWGFGLMFRWLRRKGYTWNHKRVYKIYCDLALNLRIKPKCNVPVYMILFRLFCSALFEIFLFVNVSNKSEQIIDPVC